MTNAICKFCNCERTLSSFLRMDPETRCKECRAVLYCNKGVKTDGVTRKCLKCDKMFLSVNSYRLCDPCKGLKSSEINRYTHEGRSQW